jgi:Family of unknown function (DUF6580)
MLPYLFVLFAVAVRLIIPYTHAHPWHFTPVAACLLFFGARGSRRQFWIPVVVLALSDVVLSKFVYGYPVGADQFVSWAWYAAIVLLGTRLSDNPKPVWIAASALASSVSFFLISNFAVWAAYNMYPKTFDGLLTCFAMGLPFVQRGLVGDLVFTAAMFATPALLRVASGADAGTGRAAA